MQKQIASSAVIILLFAVIAIVATTSLQHASALIASTTEATDTPSQATPPLPKLTLVHPKGTAYIDTFTDGSTTISVPGDPAIDSHFHEANAPIPTRDGMTWTGSYSYDAYDTPSGKLAVGDYAQQADGTFIVHLPAQFYTDATSTSQWPDRYVVMTSDPTVAPTAPFSPAPTAEAATEASTTPPESASTTEPIAPVVTDSQATTTS